MTNTNTNDDEPFCEKCAQLVINELRERVAEQEAALDEYGHGNPHPRIAELEEGITMSKHGGPACPCPAREIHYRDRVDEIDPMEGMTLLDRFAGRYAALIAVEWAKNGLLSAQDFKNAARDGYFLGDALVAEKRRREK